MTKRSISISWSGGKDSALALFKVLKSGEWHVDHLHTVFDADNKRVGLHGIHESLIEQQAKAIGLPLHKLYLEKSFDTNAYQHLLTSYYQSLKSQGIDHVMFGDIFLEDLKDFRDTMLKASGLKGLYPLWLHDSAQLFEEFINAGFQSMICAADGKKLNKEVVGQTLSNELKEKYLRDVDVCGENGEYHSFVYDGPFFQFPLRVFLQQRVLKEYHFTVLNEKGEKEDQTSEFWFGDILMARLSAQ